MITNPKLLVLGGTSDSLELANKLYELCPNTVLSTATEYGSCISEERFKGSIISGRKDRQQLLDYINNNGINILVDATHPYAVGISENAISACEEAGICYFRYERKGVLEGSNDITYCGSYEEAAEFADREAGNILVTTGSNNIDKFAAGIRDKKRLKIRILPVSESIIRLEQAGFNADNIIAVKGPFSEEMNYLIMVENNIKLLVCKDSGEQGGTEDKLLAAKRAGVKVLAIRRPQIKYPNIFGEMEALVQYIGKTMHL